MAQIAPIKRLEHGTHASRNIYACVCVCSTHTQNTNQLVLLVFRSAGTRARAAAPLLACYARADRARACVRASSFIAATYTLAPRAHTHTRRLYTNTHTYVVCVCVCERSLCLCVYTPRRFARERRNNQCKTTKRDHQSRNTAALRFSRVRVLVCVCVRVPDRSTTWRVHRKWQTQKLISCHIVIVGIIKTKIMWFQFEILTKCRRIIHVNQMQRRNQSAELLCWRLRTQKNTFRSTAERGIRAQTVNVTTGNGATNQRGTVSGSKFKRLMRDLVENVCWRCGRDEDRRR